MRRLWFLVAVGLVLATGCHPSARPQAEKGATLPAGNQNLAQAKREAKAELAQFREFEFDFSLTDVSGEPIRKKDFLGKVLIVDIWGTWCPPCRMEVPHFVALHERYASQGLEIVGLNSERGSPEAQAQKVREYRGKASIPYRCAIVTDRVLNQDPKFEGFPTTLFFDRQGKMRWKAFGYHEIIELQAIVEVLLEEPVAPEETKETAE